MNQVSQFDPVLRFPEVQKLTGLSRASVHALAAKNRFPRPIKLAENGRASGWLLSELQAWLEERLAQRDKA